MTINSSFARSRIKSNGSSHTQLGVSFTGPAPWDVVVEVAGPLGGSSITYPMDSSSYFGDGYYYQRSEELTGGTYTFTITDSRDNGSVDSSETAILTPNWEQEIPNEDMLLVDNEVSFDTNRPTFAWLPVPEKGYNYRLNIFSLDWKSVWASPKSTDTVVPIPVETDSILKENNAYHWRIESYDDNGNRRDSKS